METLKKGSTAKRTGLLALAAAFLFVFAETACLGADFLEPIKILLFLAVFLFPGAAAVKSFRVGGTPLFSAVLSFVLSLCLLFASYVLLSLAGLTEQWLLLSLVLFLLVGIAAAWRGRKHPFAPERDEGEGALSILFCAVAAALTMFALTASNLSPLLNGARAYHVDLLNAVGLVDSAYRGLPLEDMKASGIPYVYHLLSFSFLSVAKAATGIDNFSLVTRYAQPIFTSFAALSLTALRKRLGGKPAHLIVSFALLFLLRPFDNSFLYYLYEDTLGFSLTIGLLAASVICFLEMSEEHKVFSPTFFLFAASFFLATASKGPLAAVALCGFGISFFERLMRERAWRVIIPRGSATLAVFFLAYGLVYSGDAARLVTWYPGRFVRDTALFFEVTRVLGRESALLTIFSGVALTYLPMAVGFFRSLFLLLTGETENRAFLSFVAASSLCGMLMTHLTHQYGGSEIYFVLAAYPFAVLAALLPFQTKGAKNKRLALGIALGVLFFAISAADTAAYYKQKVERARVYAIGSPHLIDSDAERMAMEAWRADSVTRAEWDAMRWLLESTPREAKIAGDRVLLNNKYMYGTAFSERVFYLEGYVYITSYDEGSRYAAEIERRVALLSDVYRGDPTALAQLREEGVDYLLQSRWQHPVLILPAETVYENEEIVIYRLDSGT